VKRWKVAISLAVVAALVGPLVTGTWKLRPSGWHPLPIDERAHIAKMATETDNCTHFSPPETEIGKAICAILLSDLHAGGHARLRDLGSGEGPQPIACGSSSVPGKALRPIRPT
jgi:hypothetical protein